MQASYSGVSSVVVGMLRGKIHFVVESLTQETGSTQPRNVARPVRDYIRLLYNQGKRALRLSVDQGNKTTRPSSCILYSPS